ncbi:hypothetical protein NO989_04515 [Alteromonas sp. DY56-G5]|uniref:hypothetical protein n=1 Tax=Alteromonas sp. DY56-G5 TaxID=2967128 RepID=UPI003192E0E8
MSNSNSQEFPLHLTEMELKNLNRMFNIIGEEALKANYFTKSDIEDVYSILEKVRTAIFEAELDEAVA